MSVVTSFRFFVALGMLVGCRDTRPDRTSPSLDAARDGSTATPIVDAAAAEAAIVDVPTVAPTSRFSARDATRLAFIDAQHLAWAADEPLDVTVLELAAHRVQLHLRAATRAILDYEGVTALAGSRTAILTAAAGNIRSWDAKTGKLVREILPTDERRVVTTLKHLADESIVASVIPDRRAAVGQSKVEIRRWAPDGTAMFTATVPTIELWKHGNARAFALSPDGSRIATGIDQVIVFDGRTGAQIGEPFGSVKERTGMPTILALRWLDSGIVACTSESFVVEAGAPIHIVRESAPTTTFSAHRGGLEQAALLAGGRMVTAGHKDRHVTVRSSSGTPECELGGVPGDVWALAVSRDDEKVAAATDKEIIVWDLARCSAPTPPPKR